MHTTGDTHVPGDYLRWSMKVELSATLNKGRQALVIDDRPPLAGYQARLIDKAHDSRSQPELLLLVLGIRIVGVGDHRETARQGNAEIATDDAVAVVGKPGPHPTGAAPLPKWRR